VSTTDELRDNLKRTIRNRVPFVRIKVPGCRPDFYFDSQPLSRKRAPESDQDEHKEKNCEGSCPFLFQSASVTDPLRVMDFAMMYSTCSERAPGSVNA
jgi:hypothetical protein